jgi:hypothetical protein
MIRSSRQSASPGVTRCHNPADVRRWKFAAISACGAKPTPGLEPGTPSLRVKRPLQPFPTPVVDLRLTGPIPVQGGWLLQRSPARCRCGVQAQRVWPREQPGPVDAPAVSPRSRCDLRGAPAARRASRAPEQARHPCCAARPIRTLLPRPAESAVEHLLDGTQGDPIVVGTNQGIEPNERSIEKLDLGRGQVLVPRNVELLPQLLGSAALLGTGVPTSCAILTRERVGCGAVFEQARLLNFIRLARRSGKSSRAGVHTPDRRCALDGGVEKRNRWTRTPDLLERSRRGAVLAGWGASVIADSPGAGRA